MRVKERSACVAQHSHELLQQMPLSRPLKVEELC